MQPIRKIAIIGATGMLGKPVVVELAGAGFQVTAVVRNLEKAKKLLPPSVQFLKGDLSDPQSLQQALKGQDALYLSLSVEQTERKTDFHPEGEGLQNALVAAQVNGLRRVAYLSSLIMRYPTDWWVFRLKRQAIQAIKAAGIPYTIFYPSNFMETIDHQFLVGNRFLMIGKALYPNWWIAAQDYGKQVANEFKQAGSQNREYAVQGPEPILVEDVARRFKDAYLKKPVTVVRLPLGPFKFLKGLTPRFEYGYQIMKALNEYPEKFESQQTWDDLGKPTTRLEDYTRSL